MQDNIKFHCTVLGFTDIPTQEELKKARNLLIKKWHPDYYHSDERTTKELANKKTREINAAYNYLKEKDLALYSSETNEKQQDYPHYGKTPEQDFPDRDVFEVFLKSEYATSTGYNETTKTMYIRFVWGAVYKYSNVPEPIFEELNDAYSKYYFISRNIEGKFESEACYAPFYPYKGGDEGLAREKQKAQERVNRRIKREREIGEMVEFLFNNPLPNEIEVFVNNPSFSEKSKEQLRLFAKPNTKGSSCAKYINKEWNSAIYKNTGLFEKVFSILRKEKNRGVIIRNSRIKFYFYRSKVFELIRAGTWHDDGRWFSN